MHAHSTWSERECIWTSTKCQSHKHKLCVKSALSRTFATLVLRSPLTALNTALHTQGGGGGVLGEIF